MPSGKKLRLALLAPATVRWSVDDWQTALETSSRNTKLGVHAVDLPTDKLPVGRRIAFTFRWERDQRWEGVDFSVVVE